MNDTWDRLLVFCKHLCTETTYWPFLQKYWQQTTHNKKWSKMLKVGVQHLHAQKCKGMLHGATGKIPPVLQGQSKMFEMLLISQDHLWEDKALQRGFKKKKKKHKQLTFAVTAFQDGRVLSDHGSQSIDISIRRCLIHHGQVDFLGWVTSMNQTDTLLVYGVNPLTHRITQPKLSPTQSDSLSLPPQWIQAEAESACSHTPWALLRKSRLPWATGDNTMGWEGALGLDALWPVMTL